MRVKGKFNMFIKKLFNMTEDTQFKCSTIEN